MANDVDRDLFQIRALAQAGIGIVKQWEDRIGGISETGIVGPSQL